MTFFLPLASLTLPFTESQVAKINTIQEVTLWQAFGAEINA